jgi:hypothetical protein
MDTTILELVDSKTFGTGVVVLTYQPAGRYSGSQCSWAASLVLLRSVRTRRVPQYPPRRHKAADQFEVQYHCITL